MEPRGIELALFAPYNREVCIIADWTHWQRKAMEKGSDGSWRTRVELPDGEYLYKFAVRSKSPFCLDQWVEVFDPYALSITNDEREATRLAVRDGKREWVKYQWEHDDDPLPRNSDLIIYELHVGDFSSGDTNGSAPYRPGTFLSTIKKLPYLSDLGVNALELMPVKEFPGKSWGYNLRSLFAVDSGYGTPTDLCALVDACHGRGIRVIIDGVYNHAEADCPLAKIDYNYWFYAENPDPKPLQWGPKYDYTHFDKNLKVFPARKYVLESIRDWVRRFHIDGIRFDATRAIKDFGIMREFTDMAFAQVDGRKPFITVAEHVPEDPAICGYPAGPMVAAWHDRFGKQLQAIAARREHDGAEPWDLDALEKHMNPATNGYGSGNCVVNYVVSHDQVRIMRQVGEYSTTFGKPAFRRVKLVTALLLTSPGLPMLWMGQEFGAPNPKSLSPQPLNWDLLKNSDNKELQQTVAGLVNLRRKTPALLGDNFQTVLKDTTRHLFGFKRWNDAGGVVVVVANLHEGASQEFKIAGVGLEDGAWHEHFSNQDITVINGEISGSLGASEVRIYAKK